MSRADTVTAPKDTTASPETVRRLLSNRHVCPYCGNQQSSGSEPCSRCSMEDSPATRQATKARIGPWYVLQTRNPSAPGMRYNTLMSLLRKGYITPKSVVRGPTTHQLWRFAAHVRGVSREFGLCYSCGASIVRTAAFCPSCQRPQEPPADPDLLLEPRQNGNHQPKSAAAAPPVVVREPVIQATIIEPVPVVVPTEIAIEPVLQGSYARRLRELNQKKDSAVADQELTAIVPQRRSTPVVFGGGEVVSAMSLARALRGNPPQEMLVPSRRKLKIAALLAVLFLGTGGAVLYARPDYREVAGDWVNRTWTTVREKVAGARLQQNPSAQPTVAAQPGRPALPQGEPLASAEPFSQAIPDTTSAPEPQIASDPQPEPAPAEIAVAPATMPAGPVAQEALQPEIRRDPDADLNQARALWGQAIDAEARQDFASAVRIYEEIHDLPSDAWPGALQIRLDLARKRAQSSSAQ